VKLTPTLIAAQMGLMFALPAVAEPVSSQVEMAAQPSALYGTLLRPEGAIEAAAVIIPGSGPTDGDGNNPLGVKNASLKQLAEGLAAQGIATVRIDKRGIARSQAAASREEDLRFETYIDDARAWAAHTVQQLDVSCVWLIGHSEGALVAQSAATNTDSNICGQILLSGAGRPAGVVIREQLTQMPEPYKIQAFDGLAELEAGRTIPNPPAALHSLLRPSVQPYMISWISRDPAKLAHDYLGPIFIGQGTTDLQTSVADAEALSLAQPNAQMKLWQGVNHVLTQAPAERSPNLATYADPDAKIDPQVVTDVATFIKDNTL